MQNGAAEVVMRPLRCHSPLYETRESPRTMVTEEVGRLSRTIQPKDGVALGPLGSRFEWERTQNSHVHLLSL